MWNMGWYYWGEKEVMKRWDLSLDKNWDREVQLRICAGRLFHAVGADASMHLCTPSHLDSKEMCAYRSFLGRSNAKLRKTNYVDYVNFIIFVHWQFMHNILMCAYRRIRISSSLSSSCCLLKQWQTALQLTIGKNEMLKYINTSLWKACGYVYCINQ